ncbi:MAG: HEPN domain-containing protein [Candidatus Omnitrophota bacterium]|nr:HEPN domain-containing protein [Candidatus Omnitrophota bacterium]
MSRYIDKTLHGCFHPREGKPNLRKVSVNSDRIKQHINKAHNNLRAMKMMFDNDLFDWTIICGYYAMYHAVLAALFKIGIQARAHYCAIAAFKKFYVERGNMNSEYMGYIKKAKQLEQKYAYTLEKAQEDRVIEQYGVEVLTNDDAEWIMEEAQNFVLKIEEVIV